MKFNSTRGTIEGKSFEEAIFTGYAVDGGLLMPETIPLLDIEAIERWRSLCYVDLCFELLSLYISETEVPRSDLREIVRRAYSSKRFHNEDVCKLAKLDKSLYVLELFHGKTKAFKDIPLVLVAEFLEYFLERKKKHITLLVGTSGDTGSAAIESVRGMPLIDIVVLYPKGYCNKVQELQMTTVQDDNVHVFECEGTSDGLDVPVKACLVDESLVKKYNLGSINSINIGRMLAQIVYYFYAYFKVCKSIGEQVKFVIPSGAMGNVTAGFVANKMGLPIKLQCAVNDNNIVHRMIAKGDFSIAENIIKTWSTAMDIQVPYNMERIWLLVSDMNYKLVASLIEEFEKHHAVKNFPAALMEKLREVLSSGWVTRDDTLSTMNSVWAANQYLLCPHTAVGVTVATRNSHTSDTHIPVVCIATASPAKFPEAVKAAGIDVPPPPEIVALATMPTKQKAMRKGEDWEKMLRDQIKAIG